MNLYVNIHIHIDIHMNVYINVCTNVHWNINLNGSKDNIYNIVPLVHMNVPMSISYSAFSPLILVACNVYMNIHLNVNLMFV